MTSLAALVRRVLSVPTATRPRAGAVAPSLSLTRAQALVPIVIVGAWVSVIRNVQLARMNDLGLVSVLPDSVVVLLFLLTISFCLSLTRRRLEPLVPLLHVVVLIVILYGVTTF